MQIAKTELITRIEDHNIPLEDEYIIGDYTELFFILDFDDYRQLGCTCKLTTKSNFLVEIKVEYSDTRKILGLSDDRKLKPLSRRYRGIEMEQAIKLIEKVKDIVTNDILGINMT